MFDEWDTEKISELLNNTEWLYQQARECRTPQALRAFMTEVYGAMVFDSNSTAQVVQWTKTHVPDLATVDWEGVYSDVCGE